MAAQVHCIGCLETGADFPSEAYGLQMRWSLERSDDWQLLEGAGEGTSQIHMSKGADPLCTFDHPLDVRLHCDALAKAAAPRIKVEVYQLDELDRLDIAGYGMVHLPLSTGTHSLEIHCWRPAGSWYENLSAKFIGGYPRLVRPQLVVSAAERFGMATETTGTIYCTLNVFVVDLHGEVEEEEGVAKYVPKGQAIEVAMIDFLMENKEDVYEGFIVQNKL